MIPFKSIRVGPFTIPIKTMGADEAEKNLGAFSAEKMIIWLHPKLENEQILAETLLHEIMHAIYFVFGVKEKDRQERVVSQMSVGMASAIADNPKLIAWLKEKLS